MTSDELHKLVTDYLGVPESDPQHPALSLLAYQGWLRGFRAGIDAAALAVRNEYGLDIIANTIEAIRQIEQQEPKC